MVGRPDTQDMDENTRRRRRRRKLFNLSSLVDVSFPSASFFLLFSFLFNFFPSVCLLLSRSPCPWNHGMKGRSLVHLLPLVSLSTVNYICFNSSSPFRVLHLSSPYSMSCVCVCVCQSFHLLFSISSTTSSRVFNYLDPKGWTHKERS